MPQRERACTTQIQGSYGWYAKKLSADLHRNSARIYAYCVEFLCDVTKKIGRHHSKLVQHMCQLFVILHRDIGILYEIHVQYNERFHTDAVQSQQAAFARYCLNAGCMKFFQKNTLLGLVSTRPNTESSRILFSCDCFR